MIKPKNNLKLIGYRVVKDIAMYKAWDILVQFTTRWANDMYYYVKGNDAHMIHIDLIKALPLIFTNHYASSETQS